MIFMSDAREYLDLCRFRLSTICNRLSWVSCKLSAYARIKAPLIPEYVLCPPCHLLSFLLSISANAMSKRTHFEMLHRDSDWHFVIEKQTPKLFVYHALDLYQQTVQHFVCFSCFCHLRLQCFFYSI